MCARATSRSWNGRRAAWGTLTDAMTMGGPVDAGDAGDAGDMDKTGDFAAAAAVAGDAGGAGDAGPADRRMNPSRTVDPGGPLSAAPICAAAAAAGEGRGLSVSCALGGEVGGVAG
jgi:hypothetical protein